VNINGSMFGMTYITWMEKQTNGSLFEKLWACNVKNSVVQKRGYLNKYYKYIYTKFLFFTSGGDINPYQKVFVITKISLWEVEFQNDQLSIIWKKRTIVFGFKMNIVDYKSANALQQKVITALVNQFLYNRFNFIFLLKICTLH